MFLVLFGGMRCSLTATETSGNLSTDFCGVGPDPYRSQVNFFEAVPLPAVCRQTVFFLFYSRKNWHSLRPSVWKSICLLTHSRKAMVIGVMHHLLARRCLWDRECKWSIFQITLALHWKRRVERIRAHLGSAVLPSCFARL